MNLKVHVVAVEFGAWVWLAITLYTKQPKPLPGAPLASGRSESDPIEALGPWERIRSPGASTIFVFLTIQRNREVVFGTRSYDCYGVNDNINSLMFHYIKCRYKQHPEIVSVNPDNPKATSGAVKSKISCALRLGRKS